MSKTTTSNRLNGGVTRTSSTKTRVASIPAVPKTVDANLHGILDAMRQSIQVMQEQGRGSRLDAAVTFRDIDATTGQVIFPKGLTRSSGGAGTTPIAEIISRPTVPTGLKVVGGIGYAIISWDLPTYNGHAYTSVFAQPVTVGEVPSLSDDWYRVSTPGSVIDIALAAGDHWIWVKHTNKAIPAQVSSASVVETVQVVPDVGDTLDQALADALEAFERSQQDGALVDINHGSDIINNGSGVHTLDRQWGQKVAVGDIQGGVGIWGDYDADTGEGQINFMTVADNFYVIAPAHGITAPKPVFVISDGDIFMEDAYIRRAYIETIVADEITAEFINAVELTAVNITGGNITIGQGFSVDEYGHMEAAGADIDGHITARSLTFVGGASIPSEIDNSNVDLTAAIRQSTPPIGAANGTIWIDTSNDNHQYVYASSDTAEDAAFARAVCNLAGNVSTHYLANTYYSGNHPLAIFVNIASAKPYAISKYNYGVESSVPPNSPDWTLVRETAAYGSYYIYRQSTEPTAPNDGDRWINSATEEVTFYGTGSWDSIQDGLVVKSAEYWDSLNAGPVDGANIQIRSDVFNATEGWAIDSSGNVMFNNGEFRGTVLADKLIGATHIVKDETSPFTWVQMDVPNYSRGGRLINYLHKDVCTLANSTHSVTEGVELWLMDTGIRLTAAEAMQKVYTAKGIITGTFYSVPEQQPANAHVAIEVRVVRHSYATSGSSWAWESYYRVMLAIDLQMNGLYLPPIDAPVDDIAYITWKLLEHILPE